MLYPAELRARDLFSLAWRLFRHILDVSEMEGGDVDRAWACANLREF